MKTYQVVFFFNLEKNRAVQGTARNLETKNGEIDDSIKTNEELNSFF